MEWKIEAELIQLAEPKFRAFTSRLMPGTSHILGVRLPVLRKLAKRISRQDWRDYLRQAKDDTYEEIMLQGMVIGCVDCSLKERLRLCEYFIPKIDNWSVCDSFCSGLKAAKEYPVKLWEFIQVYLHTDEEYQIRFALVMMLMYFIEEEYLEAVLYAIDHTTHPGYYVRMAAAWAVSICFIRFPEPTLEYLKRSALDDWTYNKSLQKIRESQCVNKEIKKVIALMRR